MKIRNMRNLSLHTDNHETAVTIGHRLTGNLSRIQAGKMICLVDQNVMKYHADKLKDYRCIIVEPGELHKSLAYAEKLMRRMIEYEVDRSSFLVGIGGGLVTDLAGFVASVYMRGIRFGFISTTLLGQVDASIGGKNGVNLDGYKNMVGIIRQPEFVWCDLDFLSSLKQDELVSGFSEVIKYGAIRDKELFSDLESHHQDILARNLDLLESIVSSAASIKIDIVESDVTEKGDRKLLNFGHTLGHAIEKLTGRLHGESIAIGMVLASRLSVNMGFLKEKESARLEKLLEVSGLPVNTDLDKNLIFETLLKDKKRSGGKIDFILLRNIGDAFINPIDLNTLRTAINDLY